MRDTKEKSRKTQKQEQYETGKRGEEGEQIGIFAAGHTAWKYKVLVARSQGPRLQYESHKCEF